MHCFKPVFKTPKDARRIREVKKMNQYLTVILHTDSSILLINLNLIRIVSLCCIVICWFMQKYIYWIHTDAMIKTQEDFFRKVYTSQFICKVRKGCVGFACERELETKQKLQYIDPHSYAVHVVSFSFSRLLNQRPTLLGDGFLYCILSATSMDSNSTEPEGPFDLMWLSLPHLVYNSVRSLSATSVLTELYNSPTPTQSPTRSLESHVWSSLSGNNCHAVHRSLSSGASVYECTMGIFLPRPIPSANFRPRDFLL